MHGTLMDFLILNLQFKCNRHLHCHTPSPADGVLMYIFLSFFLSSIGSKWLLCFYHYKSGYSILI